MSFKYSFTPGEIMAPGTTLEIYTPRPVDSKSAEDAVRHYSGGNALKTSIAVDKKVLKISTQGLVSSNYQLRIGKILDNNRQPINDDTIVVAFVIGSMFGRVPKELRVEHVVHLAVGETSSRRLHPGTLAAPGERYLEIVKA